MQSDIGIRRAVRLILNNWLIIINILMNEIIRELKIILFRANHPAVSCKPYSGIMGASLLDIQYRGFRSAGLSSKNNYEFNLIKKAVNFSLILIPIFNNHLYLGVASSSCECLLC